MAQVCKDIIIGGGTINDTCCGCPTLTSPCVYTASVNPYVSYIMGTRNLFDFSPTQYIIPIKITCGCKECSGNEDEIHIEKVHSIRVIGSNPANVSFAMCNGQTFSHTTPSVWSSVTYSSAPIYGLCMIVDKDPNHIETPKASTIQVGIQKCASDVEFVSTLKTEYFFNANFAMWPNASVGCPTFVVNDVLANWTTTLQAITGNDYIKYNCNQDMGSYYRTPLTFESGCKTSSWNHPLKTIQSITYNGNSTGYSGVTVTYDPSHGMWFVNIPKSGGTLYNAQPFYIDITVDILTPPLSMCSLSNGGDTPQTYTNEPIIQTLNFPQVEPIANGGLC